MSYDPQDDAWSDFYEQVGEELYPEHYERAVEQFKNDRLRSYYKENSFVMRPAIESLQLGKKLRKFEDPSPSLVFCVSATELLLKATILKPVVYGLVHIDKLADIIVSNALGQSGFDRYEALLAKFFEDIAGIDLKNVSREGVKKSLLAEAKEMQKIRNSIIHKGDRCKLGDAERAFEVSVSVFELIVKPMLAALGLKIIDKGEIVVGDP